MEFISLSFANAREAFELLEKDRLPSDIHYRIRSAEELTKLVLTPLTPDDRVFAYMEKEKRGLIAGFYDHKLQKFFLTLLFVLPSFRKMGVGEGLLTKLQESIDQFAIEQKLALPDLEISFYNPLNLPWYLPHEPSMYHQNAQGVLLGSEAHLFFKNQGFRDFSYQNTYGLFFDEFILKEDRLAPYRKRLLEGGYELGFYDPNIHHGFLTMVDDLHNEIWSRQLPEELSLPRQNRPIVIIHQKGEVKGFAGPVVVEESGRAWLLGVAVHPSARRVGAATLLFNEMCQAFKEAGAAYMTFFTGEDNPARNIYEGAGFKIRASFACMRRRRESFASV